MATHKSKAGCLQKTVIRVKISYMIKRNAVLNTIPNWYDHELLIIDNDCVLGAGIVICSVYMYQLKSCPDWAVYYSLQKTFTV